MKSTLLPVVLLWGSIGLVIPVSAEPIQSNTLDEPIQPSASDLLIPEEKIPESFEYDTDALNQLSTQINHSVEAEDGVQIVRPSPDGNTTDGLVIINSDGNVLGGREVPLR